MGIPMIISFKKIISPQPVGGPSKRKNLGALGTCPVCPLVKTALLLVAISLSCVFGDALRKLPPLNKTVNFIVVIIQTVKATNYAAARCFIKMSHNTVVTCAEQFASDIPDLLGHYA